MIGIGVVHYYVNYSDVSDATSELERRALLNEQRDMMLREVGARLVSEGQMKLNEHEGLRFRLETPRMTGEQRLFLVDGRLYELGVNWERRWGCAPDTEMFFDSFRLRAGAHT